MRVLKQILFYLVIFSILGLLVVQLFFKEEFDSLREKYFHSAAQTEIKDDKSLTIVYSSSPDSLDPTAYDSITRGRTLNVYEGLVAMDRNLRAKPSLALSWGRISDTEWEFKLRPNVVFHDGSKFDSDDVLASFNRATTHKESGLKDILDTIDSIEKEGDMIVRIKTKEPDPILVSRMAAVLIFPSELKSFSTPVGTGAYRFVSNTENEFSITRFDNYWGSKPYFKNVFIKTIANRFDRLDAIKTGQIDILAAVPPTMAEELEIQQNVSIKSLPSLEVNFIMFNYESELLKDIRIREAISLAFDKDIFVEISNGYATPSDQFISNGIFGFNPEIKKTRQDVSTAKQLIRQYDPFKKPSVNVDMIQEAQAIGEYVYQQLNEIGLSANINYVSFDELKKKILNKESEMYYLGWRSEVGDASGFYENVIYSKGLFNGNNFENKKVDQLIRLSIKNLDEKKRLDQFQEIMKIIVEEEKMGVPLFETHIIYGVRAGIHFNPRLDGYILASEIY